VEKNENLHRGKQKGGGIPKRSRKTKKTGGIEKRKIGPANPGGQKPFRGVK